MTSVEVIKEIRGRKPVPLAVTKLSARDRLALAIATVGVGYIPIVPATWASAVTAAFYWLLLSGIGRLYLSGLLVSPQTGTLEAFRQTCILVLLVPLGLAGIWAANRAEKLFGRKDPKPVVIDEVIGQLITFLFLPYAAGPILVVLGFFLFRAFDIFKPYPIRRLEALPGGLGIIADDVLAGAYAAILLSLVSQIPGLNT
jgi:phosphatidylglycerophosphatase A